MDVRPLIAAARNDETSVPLDSRSAFVLPWSIYTERQRWGFLAVLFLVSTSSYFDRSIVAVILEAVKHEFQVSDTLLGVLSGFSFIVFYSILGMPVARWADRGNRRTIITIALTVWSAMTVLCGLAQAFWHLALARIGVGAGESGAIPPAQSLIVDYFPAERRATALSIFNASVTAGYLLGIGLGGYIAATRGWRSAFLCAGAPGLVLAIIARLALAEPRLQLGFDQPGKPAEGLAGTLTELWRKRSFRYALVGSCFGSLYSYGVVVFIPAFQVRVLHASLTEVSVKYGVATAAASLLGTLGSGWLADRLGRRDIRWIAWLAAVGSAVGGIVYMLALSTNDFGRFIALAFVATVLVSGGTSIYAAIHAVCGGRRRATAIALFLFLGTLVGGGLGPLAIGALSDELGATFGTEGLRYSLIAMMSTLVACGVFYYLLGREMPCELEE